MSTTPEPAKVIAIHQTVSVKKLSDMLHVPVSSVITELMKNGIIATINEDIDFDTASIIASDLGYEIQPAEEDLGNKITLETLPQILAAEQTSGEPLAERAPIVTILGHVDHGKTTLLDTIRKTSVATGEAGGITQCISAYQVKKHGKMITFIDTPGHEAFSGMRKRGISIADIAILVVSAEDGVRPQTKEVIDFIKERKIPVIVAINKIDKPDAKPDRVKQELAEHGILFEDWGGDVICNYISAKNNVNIDKLLDSILLVSEVEGFRANQKRDGLAVVLESNLDPQRGPVATILVRTGTLKIGQDVIAGGTFGRIRRIEDFIGRNLTTIGPSIPATIFGFNTPPAVNDIVQVVSGKAIARLKSQEQGERNPTLKKIKNDGGNEHVKRFRVIIKADVQGSVEAVQQILSGIGNEEIVLEEISSGVGAITESDVKLAESTGAMIFGFAVEPTAVAKRIAENAKVAIETFTVIYKLVEVVKMRMSALLPPETFRTDFGRLSVLAVFKTGKRDMIVGGRVSEGKIVRGTLLEIKRGDEIIGQGNMGNLQWNKENADEVGQGNECGVVFDGTVKIQVGDTLLCYKEEEKRRSL